jgi:hypothetical protein
MKKFVFISLILALVAGVAFAQDEGSWSVSGRGEIGTLFNFSMRVGPPGDNHISPRVGASGYNMYGYYGNVPTGTLGVTYSKGDLSAGLSFDIADNVYADVSYNSDTAAFQANIGLLDLFMKDDGGPTSGANYEPGRLWGYYKFLDGKIHLEAAVLSRDTNWWISNEAVGNIFDSSVFAANWAHATQTGMGWGFTSVDHHTYLVANFAPIEGLEVGFMLPAVFATPVNADNASNGSGSVNGGLPWGAGDGYHDVFNGTSKYEFLYNVFQNMVFGAKYATGPVEVAAQFAFRGDAGASTDSLSVPNDKKDKVNTAVYLGGFYSIADGIRAGLAMEATFDGQEAKKIKDGSGGNQFGIAASFNYGAGALSAGLEGGLFFQNNFKDKDAKDKGTLGLKPQVAYNIIENYLCLSLESFLFFHLDSDVSKQWGIGYEITPELWFNIAGTGAGKGYYWPNGGPAIILRYKVGGFTKNGAATDPAPAQDPSVNAVDITFKWAF